MEKENLIFTRINNDVNGNPRYVVHYTNLIAAQDEGVMDVTDAYRIAVIRANYIGGRKYTSRSYGGGIVFTSYSIDETAAAISKITGRSFIPQQAY